MLNIFILTLAYHWVKLASAARRLQLGVWRENQLTKREILSLEFGFFAWPTTKSTSGIVSPLLLLWQMFCITDVLCDDNQPIIELRILVPKLS